MPREIKQFCKRNHDRTLPGAVLANGECRECKLQSCRDWKAAHPDYMWAKHIQLLYGITAEDYDALLVRQNGGCAICGTTKPGGRGSFHVDHDHTTGVVRGLLCHGCNVGIGNLGDDPDRLMAAVAYLLSHTNQIQAIERG